LSSLFAQLHDDPPGEWADLGKKLVEHGLPLTPGWDKGKWDWNDQAKGSQRLQHQAVTRVRKWMTDCDPPVMMHRDAPW
ncbi:DEAD/DEAH box helicase, partial [Rhodococcus sp. IEGM 1307]|nr:DEAD/DEAH box helicase [Rhodococcus sp. IEGM 1307]